MHGIEAAIKELHASVGDDGETKGIQLFAAVSRESLEKKDFKRRWRSLKTFQRLVIVSIPIQLIA